MTVSEKIDAYQHLVEKVKYCNKLDDCNTCSGKNATQLEKCLQCDEINLWSYWQGGENSLNADILLVGQDWGNYHTKKGNVAAEIISRNKRDPKIPYIKDNDSRTDMNLCELFKSLGDEYDVAKPDNSKVFFTNFVLCYRKAGEKTSGGFKQKWASNCAEYFKQLVTIIEPKVIICLGRSVFDNVLKAAGEKAPKGNYNSIIESGKRVIRFGDVECAVFPMAHCGVFGTYNRNSGKNDTTSINLQIQDWKKVKDHINSK